MADIEKVQSEPSNIGDTNVTVGAVALVREQPEQMPLPDAPTPFFGELYQVQLDKEQAHVREELVLFLRKHAPAFGKELVFIPNYVGYSSDIIMFAGTQAATHHSNYIPPVPPTPQSYQASGSDLVFTPDKIGYIGASIMFAGMPLQDKKTQLIYIAPSNGILDIGTLTSPTTALITIHNPSADSAFLNALDLPSSFGINILGFVAGFELQPQQSITYTVEITMDGQKEINANFYFNTNLGRLTYTLVVQRTSLILLNMEPNAGTYAEKYSYSTKIFTGMTQKEARKVFRELPRISVSYTVNIYNYALYKYAKDLALFAMVNPSQVQQPLWLQATKLEATLVAQTIIPCDTTDLNFVEGNTILIQNGPRTNVHLTKITSISLTQIGVTDPITADKGADIVPTFLGWTGQSSSGTYKNGKVHSHTYNVQEFNYG